ncbi:DUF4097 domain-containing protein [bacterium]|nr:DUF4097 domain-containing protein [bacterium]
MKKFLLLILSTAALAIGQTVTGSSGDYRVALDQRFAASPGGTLTVDNMNGDITVQGGGDQVIIHADLHVEVLTREELDRIVNAEKAAFQQQAGGIMITSGGTQSNVVRHLMITLPEKFNLLLKARRGDIQVERVSGQIQLHSAGGDVSLKETGGAIEVKTAGGDLIFDGVHGSLRASTAGGDVDLKNIFSEAIINTAGGDIELLNAKNKIELSTAGGDLVLQKISGSLKAETMGGDITLTDVQGGSVQISTMGGDIDVANCRSALQISTHGGDIEANRILAEANMRTMGGEIQVKDLQAAATAVSMGGDISIEMTLTDFSKPHALHAETTGGDIRVILPALLPARILAEVRLSRRSGSRNDIYSDFPLTKSSQDETGRKILRSTGEINGGGDVIELKTDGGDVTILKAR